MGANTFGTYFKISTFGESHGPAMGVVIDGCPAGIPFSWDLLNQRMQQRRPGCFAWVSNRNEADTPEVLSGIFEDRTLGTPLAMIVKNKDARSEHYESMKKHFRRGHADDVWKKKFGHRDHRGGGRASGRETVGRVLGATVAEMFLNHIFPNIRIIAVPVKIGHFVRKNPLQNKNASSHKLWFGQETQKVEQFLIDAKSKGLSYGGSVVVKISHAPRGLGQPVFRKLKSDLASAFMSIGACYAVSLGNMSEQELCSMEGSVLHQKDKSVYGGILGGISTGEDIIFHLHFKPPASVLNIAKQGRHDPCIIPRVSVVAASMAWLVIAEHVLWHRLDRVSV